MFKNKEGKLRSGWNLLLLSVCMLGLIFIMQLILGGISGAYLAISGNINTVTGEITAQGTSILAIVNGIAMLLQEIVLIGIPILAWCKFMKKPIVEMGLKPLKKHGKEFAIGLGLGFVLMIFVFLGIVATGNAVIATWKPTFSPKMLLNLGLFILVGFGEEIYGRGYIMSVLRQTKNKWLIFIVSAVIFALLHSGNQGIGVVPYINLALVGIFLAYVYYRSGNIWLCIGYHITWNFFQGIFGFPVSGTSAEGMFSLAYEQNTIWNGGAFGPEGGLFVTIAVILAIVFTYFFYRNSNYDFLLEGASIEQEVVKEVVEETVE